MLFVCRLNRRRSATAERIFSKDPDLDVRSAGTSADALVRVNGRMLDWAEIVFAMDATQVAALERQFPGHPALAKVVCLDIPDEYTFLDPALVALLRERLAPYRTSDG